MTVRFKKKARKWRGRTSHGYGSKKKHRGGGSMGGRGISGRHKHKYSYVVSKEPDYYGKRGFHSPMTRDKIINVGDLERIAPSQSNEINLASMGYSKLLSRGYVSKPYKITVERFTERAKAKIEKAGGQIITKAAKDRPSQPEQQTNARVLKAARAGKA